MHSVSGRYRRGTVLLYEQETARETLAALISLHFYLKPCELKAVSSLYSILNVNLNFYEFSNLLFAVNAHV